MASRKTEKESLSSKIAGGLGSTPAYLFLYGLVALFALPGGGVTIYEMNQGNTTAGLIIGVLFVVVLAAAVLVIRFVEPSRAPAEKQEPLVYEKMVYAKVLHLSKSAPGKPAIYNRMVGFRRQGR